MPQFVLTCCSAGALTAVGAAIDIRALLDIGVKIPKGSTNGLNGTVCTTTNRESNSLMGTARSYANIKRGSSGNFGTSSGMSVMEIFGAADGPAHGSARDGFYYGH